MEGEPLRARADPVRRHGGAGDQPGGGFEAVFLLVQGLQGKRQAGGEEELREGVHETEGCLLDGRRKELRRQLPWPAGHRLAVMPENGGKPGLQEILPVFSQRRIEPQGSPRGQRRRDHLLPQPQAERVVAFDVAEIRGPPLEVRHEVVPQTLEAVGELADIVEGEQERNPIDQGLLVDAGDPGEPAAEIVVRLQEPAAGGGDVQAVEGDRVVVEARAVPGLRPEAEIRKHRKSLWCVPPRHPPCTRDSCLL
jgi:hypothetical protein